MTTPIRQIVDRCDSTNTLARSLADSGAPHGSWVSARIQDKGRGRHGRSWGSIEGNLFLSLVVRIENPALWTWIPLVTGIAVTRFLRREFPGLLVQLKWPNDLRVSRSKLGGILCEGVLGRDAPFVIAGLGLNCIRAPEIVEQATTSLSHEWNSLHPLGKEIRADDIRSGIAEEILFVYSELLQSGVTPLTREFEIYSELVPGTQIEWADVGSAETHHGEVLGLGVRGELRVQENKTEKFLTSEEVKLKLR